MQTVIVVALALIQVLCVFVHMVIPAQQVIVTIGVRVYLTLLDFYWWIQGGQHGGVS